MQFGLRECLVVLLSVGYLLGAAGLGNRGLMFSPLLFALWAFSSGLLLRPTETSSVPNDRIWIFAQGLVMIVFGAFVIGALQHFLGSSS